MCQFLGRFPCNVDAAIVANALSGLRQDSTPALRLLQVKSCLGNKHAACNKEQICLEYLIDFFMLQKKNKKNHFPPFSSEKRSLYFSTAGNSQSSGTRFGRAANRGNQPRMRHKTVKIVVGGHEV